MSSGAQPDPNDPLPLAGSHFIYPRVVSGLLNGLTSNQKIAGGNSEDVTSSATRTLIATELTLTPETLNITLSEADVLDIKSLEFTPEPLVTDEASYLAWSQQEADLDADGDGLDASAEFYFGLDARIPGQAALQLVSLRPITMQVSRNPLASGAPTVFESKDLVEWIEVEPTQVNIRLGDDQDLLRIKLSSDVADAPYFWKVEAP